MFATRAAAGRALASALRPDALWTVHVIAVSREGVAVGAHVAAPFGAELDLICTRYNEVAVAIEGCRPYVELERVIQLGLHAANVTDGLAELQRQLEQAMSVFRGNRPFPSVHEQHVVMVDDGLTPARVVTAAASRVRSLGAARITIAVPVGTPKTLRAFGKVADDVICLEQANRRGVAFSYDDADPIGDLEALTLLGRSRLAASHVRFSSSRTITIDDPPKT